MLSLENLTKRAWLFMIILAAFSLAGCLPQASTMPPLVPTSSPTPTAIAQPLPTAIIAVPTVQEVSLESGCTAVTKKPTPAATQETVYPPITEADHAKGPTDARVTILEYSDFQ